MGFVFIILLKITEILNALTSTLSQRERVNPSELQISFDMQ